MFCPSLTTPLNKSVHHNVAAVPLRRRQRKSGRQSTGFRISLAARGQKSRIKRPTATRIETFVAIPNGVKSERKSRTVLNTRYPQRNCIEKPPLALKENGISLMKGRP